MNIIDSTAALDAVADLTLRPILERFADLMDLAILYVAEAGDTLASIEQACGSPLEGWEYVHIHPTLWFELVFIESDYGDGFVVLVPDRPGIDTDLLTLCRANASAPDDF